MVIIGAALRLAGAERHLRGLAALVAQHDAEPVAELEVLVPHGVVPDGGPRKRG
jgi:hypothetical protein